MEKQKWTLEEYYNVNINYNYEKKYIDFCGDELKMPASEQDVEKLARKIYEEGNEEYGFTYEEVDAFIEEQIQDYKDELERRGGE